MAEADPKMITEPAAHGAAEEVMASSASDSGEESDSNSSSSTSSCSSSSNSSSSSSSSSSSGSSSSSSSSSGSQVYRKKRVPEPSRRAQLHLSGKYFMDKLPQAVRNRVQALRNIQDECDKVDTLFLRAIHDLERKYAELNKPLYDKRFQIINAEYEPTEEECEWNSDEEFSGDEEILDDTPNEMPPLEGEEEEESCKEKTEVKEEEKDVPKEVPAAKVEENKAPEEIPEVKTEEKEIPKEVPEEVQEKEATEEILEVKADEKEAAEEIPEVKFEEKEASEEIPEVKFEEKEASEEIPEVKFEEKADSTDYIEITPIEKEDPKEVPQANAENKDQPTEESKARAPVREAQKRVPETRPEEGGNVKRARKRKPKREDPKGIPDYWLTVLKNVDKLGPMIQKYDEPILKFLSDVSLKFSNPGQPISYTFEFHFLPNPYFRNEFLVKTYIIRSKPDHYDPFFAWGWEIEECKGCKIDWRRGKDVTVKTTLSRPAATGETEVQPRVVRNASFFNFFSPPEIPLIGKLEPREDAILDEDFEIGQILHDNVILKSIFYFTGEINDPYYHDVRDYGSRKYYK